MASPVTTAVHLAPQLRRICDINSTRVSVIAPAGPSRREVALGVPTVLLNSLAVAQLTRPVQAATPAGRLPTPEEMAAIESALKATIPRGRSPAALRLVFHDAGTFSVRDGIGGPNASIRYELDRPENNGLKKVVRSLDDAMGRLSATPAAESVSFADMIVLGGAYAIRVCGGPTIPVRIGRVDATAADPEGRLPMENFGSEQLKEAFRSQGMGVKELVALAGAHTIGGKGFGDPTGFDNDYYKALLKRPWEQPGEMNKMVGLPSDHVLPDDPEALPFIELYAQDQDAFFRDFSSAFVALTEQGAAWRF